MNIVSITGRLARNAIVNGSGDKKAMKFTVAASSGYDSKKCTERVEFTPCVYFNPAEKLHKLLSSEGQGKLVELQGNVITSSYSKNGTKIWATEVRVTPSTFQLLPSGKRENGTKITEYITGGIPP
jgi:single-stranded DNA-binding protein